ncbi:MAG: hypothetical protein ACRCVT_05005, partial [Leadbetterella sp.]
MIIRPIHILFILFLYSNVFSQGRDMRIVESIHTGRLQSLDKSMYVLGESSHVLNILYPLAQLSTGFVKGDNSLKWKSIQSGTAVIGTFAIGYIIKKSYDRSRPYEVNPRIFAYKVEKDGSFPSGSTAS